MTVPYNNTLQTVWDEGHEAFGSGITQNPYPAGTFAHREWAKGYEDARNSPPEGLSKYELLDWLEEGHRVRGMPA